MSKLSDVNYSQQGEQVQQEKQATNLSEQAIVSAIKNDGVNAPSQVVHVFKLASSNRNGGVYINGEADLVNPATGNTERARLLYGVTTIWMKEQKDLTPEYVNNNLRSLKFARGTRMLRIPDSDQAGLLYARLNFNNIGSKGNKSGGKMDYYEYDPAKEDRETLLREDFELEMAIAAKQMDKDEMMKHAAFLGISLTTDLGLKSPEGIRIEYVRAAKRNPQFFKDTMGSVQVNIAWMVRTAIIENKIEINREPGKVYWAQGGGMIAVYPQGVDPSRYLVDLAMMNTQEGIKFKEALQKIST